MLVRSVSTPRATNYTEAYAILLYMALPPSTPPPKPPQAINVAQYLQAAGPPPWVNSATIESLAAVEGELKTMVQDFDRWSKDASEVLLSLGRKVEENGASNLLQVIEGVDAAAREMDELSKGFPETMRSMRKASQNLRRLATEFQAMGDSQSAAETMAKSESARRKAELMKVQEGAIRRVLDAYRSTLMALVRVRDAELTRSSSAATFALLCSWDDDAAEV